MTRKRRHSKGASSDALFYQPIDGRAPILSFRDVYFSYADSEAGREPALAGLNLEMPRGQHLAVIGRNGSGKSTFAKLCNALELPDRGEVLIEGRRPRSLDDIYAIRQCCGMVFQNPDNQIVGTTVEEDCAFGPENLGLSSEEIQERVQFALARSGMTELAKRPPSELSGGQKQKLAIAGALSMRPRCLILDEACAMLDPAAGDAFLRFADQLSREEGLSLVQITHDMEQASMADRIVVLDRGQVLAEGSPRDIFSQSTLLFASGLQLPPQLELLRLLGLKSGAFTLEEVADLLAEKLRNKLPDPSVLKSPGRVEGPKQRTVIEVQNLSFSYNCDAVQPVKALDQLSFEVRQGEVFVICGHSGSGKSTLITHLNGLFRPQQGSIRVLDLDVSDKKKLLELRRHIGLVFQYPEYQLFETTVADDIAYGPKQMGFSESECQAAVRHAMDLLGLGPELAERSPFELSGGQKRRVAIAGVLALDPEILVMDEPAAGLDPEAREEMLRQIERFRERGKTVVMVTHNMDDAARLADYVAVLREGRIIALDKPEVIFRDAVVMEQSGLTPPASMRMAQALNERLGSGLSFLSMPQAAAELAPYLREEGGYAE